MAIFISYSHADADFVTNLARNLVDARHNVWIDRWEVNAGESLIDRVQEAIGASDALLVILSQHSIDSNWCKKELNSGLVRELDEKKVLIIPVVIGDVEVPLFLREKLYVDFRSNADEAFYLLDRSLRKVTNAAQSRVETENYHTDWSLDWAEIDGTPFFEWTFVEHGIDSPYSILMQVRVVLDDMDLEAFNKLISSGEHIRFGSHFIEDLLEKKDGKMRVLIEDNRKIEEIYFVDGPDDQVARLIVSVRRLGVDNGMDTLYAADNVLQTAISHSRNALKKPSVPT